MKTRTGAVKPTHLTRSDQTDPKCTWDSDAKRAVPARWDPDSIHVWESLKKIKLETSGRKKEGALG